MGRDRAIDASKPLLPTPLVVVLDIKPTSGLEWVLISGSNRLLFPQGRFDVKSGYSSVDGSLAHNLLPPKTPMLDVGGGAEMGLTFDFN